MLQLEQIHPVRLHEVWNTIVTGLAVVAAKSRVEWWPQDVYAAIKAGVATLHLGKLDGDYAGFMVMTQHIDNDSGKRSLVVWIAYSNRHGLLSEGLAKVYEMAHAGGFAAVKMHTTRRGWIRHLEKAGWILGDLQLEKSLVPEPTYPLPHGGMAGAIVESD